MIVPKYISDLLFTEECVIVPGFGGFITSVKPAATHSAYPIIYPPSKSILFNPRLTRNDGLLVAAIAKGENISYEEALNLVNNEIDAFRHTLDHREKLILENVGTLKKGTEGTLDFEQDHRINYLEESFGLSNVVCQPLHAEKEITEAFPGPAFTPVFSLKQRVYRVGKVAAVPLFLTIGTLIFYQNILRNPHLNYNSFLSLESRERAVVEKKTDISSSKAIQPMNTVKVEPARTPASSVSKPPVQKKELPAEINDRKYYIVGGAFRSVENAEKFADQLLNQGFKPEIAGKNPAGLTLVAYASFAGRSEAETSLAEIRLKDNSQAWILEK